MVIRLAKVLISEIATRVGWLLLLGGLILPVGEFYDHLTAKDGVATVIAVKTVCERHQCSLGKCRWRRIKCEEANGTAPGEIRTIGSAKLSINTNLRRPATTWARFTKLQIKHAEVGDTLQIRYRGKRRPYVTIPLSMKNVRLGFLISFAGVALLFLGRPSKQKAAPVPTASPREPVVDVQSRQPAAPLPAPSRIAGRPNTEPVISPAVHATNRPAYIPPDRKSSVQRQRGWFS